MSDSDAALGGRKVRISVKAKTGSFDFWPLIIIKGAYNLLWLGGSKAPQRGRKDEHKGPKIETPRFSLYWGAHPSCPQCGAFLPPSAVTFWPQLKYILGDKFRGFGGFLDPCDQNETYHASNQWRQNWAYESNLLGWRTVPLIMLDDALEIKLTVPVQPI